MSQKVCLQVQYSGLIAINVAAGPTMRVLLETTLPIVSFCAQSALPSDQKLWKFIFMFSECIHVTVHCTQSQIQFLLAKSIIY